MTLAKIFEEGKEADHVNIRGKSTKILWQPASKANLYDVKRVNESVSKRSQRDLSYGPS